MLDRGVYLPPSAFESWFLSAAHDDAALDRVVEALPAAARAAAAASGSGRSGAGRQVRSEADRIPAEGLST
jgi:hypothetical protein